MSAGRRSVVAPPPPPPRPPCPATNTILRKLGPNRSVRGTCQSVPTSFGVPKPGTPLIRSPPPKIIRPRTAVFFGHGTGGVFGTRPRYLRRWGGATAGTQCDRHRRVGRSTRSTADHRHTPEQRAHRPRPCSRSQEPRGHTRPLPQTGTAAGPRARDEVDGQPLRPPRRRAH